MSSGAGAENVDAALQLLTDSKPARVLIAQVRQPFSDRNGRDGQGYGGRKHVDDMNMAELRQEVSENSNTINQLQRSTEQSKQQRQNNWKVWRRGQDPQQTEQPAPKTGVQVPEGGRQGNQGTAKVSSQGPSQHVEDKPEII